jgi:hypothetical protein
MHRETTYQSFVERVIVAGWRSKTLALRPAARTALLYAAADSAVILEAAGFWTQCASQ